jgi:hypothetical protein
MTPSQEDDATVHQRLVEIARRKREVLSRVYEPGTEPPATQATPGPSIPEIPASEKAACSLLRNRGDWYNEFDDCDGLKYLDPPEIGGSPRVGAASATGDIELRAGRAPKKKDGDDDEDETITRRVDKRLEKDLQIHKVRPTCMVCTIPLKGATFICPNCETKYCMRCAQTLASRKEYCWTCRKPLKVS